MLTVHPEYDVDTRTWFVPDMEFEAPTLAQLARLLGSQVTVRDYYPRGLGPQIAVTHIERETRRSQTDAPPPVMRPHLENRRQKPVARQVKQKPAARQVKHPGERRPGESRYNRDQILDLWAAGLTDRQIKGSVAGGISRSHLHSLIKQAREAGDPRAVRHNRGYAAAVNKGTPNDPCPDHDGGPPRAA